MFSLHAKVQDRVDPAEHVDQILAVDVMIVWVMDPTSLKLRSFSGPTNGYIILKELNAV